MATPFSGDTVWMGFMDIVPVIGTVRESVELVLAVYEGNEAVVKEKEKAIENIVKASSQKHVRKGTVPVKPAGDEYSGLRNVREVRRENIIEYMGKGSRTGKGTKPLTPAQREKKLEAINKDMLAKIRLVNQNFQEVLKEQLERSARGEHVFNNSILRFHSDVLTAFIQKYRLDNIPRYNQQTMTALGRHTLPQNTETEIQTNMVVHFGEDEFYVNANGLMYGEYCRALRQAMLDVLDHRNPDAVPEEERPRVLNIIDNMNNFEIYVDYLAKVKWIANNASRQARFDVVKEQVAAMFSTGRGYDWCIDVLREVAPLFGY